MEKEKGFKELGGGKKFFRKGIVGNWQNNLDPKLVKTIEENFYKEMKELEYIQLLYINISQAYSLN